MLEGGSGEEAWGVTHLSDHPARSSAPCAAFRLPRGVGVRRDGGGASISDRGSQRFGFGGAVVAGRRAFVFVTGRAPALT
jgi:hypothetical protein